MICDEAHTLRNTVTVRNVWNKHQVGINPDFATGPTLFFLRSCRGQRWGPISQFAQSKLPDVVESMAGRPPWMWEQLRVHEYDGRPGEVRLQSSLAVDV